MNRAPALAALVGILLASTACTVPDRAVDKQNYDEIEQAVMETDSRFVSAESSARVDGLGIDMELSMVTDTSEPVTADQLRNVLVAAHETATYEPALWEVEILSGDVSLDLHPAATELFPPDPRGYDRVDLEEGGSITTSRIDYLTGEETLAVDDLIARVMEEEPRITGGNTGSATTGDEVTVRVDLRTATTEPLTTEQLRNILVTVYEEADSPDAISLEVRDAATGSTAVDARPAARDLLGDDFTQHDADKTADIGDIVVTGDAASALD